MSTYSNLFASQPLTTENLRNIVMEMIKYSTADNMVLNVKPDTLVVPWNLILDTKLNTIATVERCAREIARPLHRGRIEQRRRRKAQGIVGKRAARRLVQEQRMIAAQDFCEMFEAAIETSGFYDEPRQKIENGEWSNLFQTKRND